MQIVLSSNDSLTVHTYHTSTVKIIDKVKKEIHEFLPSGQLYNYNIIVIILLRMITHTHTHTHRASIHSQVKLDWDFPTIKKISR